MTDSNDTPTSSYRSLIPPRPADIRAAEDWVAKAMRETAGALGAELVDRPGERHPDSMFRERIPKPPHGLLAALKVQAAAAKQALEQANHARGYGMTWWELAEALPEHHPAHNNAGALFALLVPEPSTPGYHRSTSWHCMSCGQVVSDRGTDNGVKNDEHGHAEDCARHARDIAAQVARFERGW